MTDRRDVASTYDRIAEHFSATREYAWPEVEDFLDEHASAHGSGVALDLGCGNGRHAELLAPLADRVVGIDASTGLLREAEQRAIERSFELDVIAGDASQIPLNSDSVDIALYVATIHHLPSRKVRIDSLVELARVLDPDGIALVSVWSTAHSKFDQEEGFDTTIDWTLPEGETVPRYYHIYSPDEFREDLDAALLDIGEFEISSGNCYATVRPEGKRP